MSWIDELQEIPHSDEWADAEQAFCRFTALHSEHDVLRRMTDAQFAAWQAEYKRLYNAVWEAQIAYYKAIRGLS